MNGRPPLGKSTFILLIVGLFCLPTVQGWGQTFPEEPTLRLGKGIIYDIAYAPDGQTLAVASSVGVWLYDAQTLSELGLLPARKNPAYRVAFSPDGTTLVTSLGGRKTLLWDVKQQKIVGRLETGFPFAFSPDGKILASVSSAGKTISLWNIKKGELLGTLEGANQSISALAFSPDGKTVASGGWDYVIDLWDVPTRTLIGTLEGHKDWIYDLAFSPDGRWLVSVGDGIRLWDVQGQKQVKLLDESILRLRVDFSPDAKLLAVGNGLDRVRLWDMERLEVVAEFGQPDHYLRKLVFHPNGKQLATWGQDRAIRIWNLDTRQQIGWISGYTDAFEILFITPNGKFVITDRGIWDVETQKPIELSEPIRPWAMSPDGQWLAITGRGGFRIWDLQTQKDVAFLKGGPNGIVRSAAFSPDKTLLAVGGDDRNIWLWRIADEKLIATLPGHTGSVQVLAFSPDGTLLASGGRWPDTTIRLWDVQKLQDVAVLRDHTGGIKSLAFSPDGTLLASGSWDNPARLWDVRKKKAIALLQTSGEAVAFSPDGEWLATAQGPENTVQVWRAKTGELATALEGHTAWVRALAFSRNGRWLASAGRDGTVLLWEVNLPSPYPVEARGKLKTTLGHLKRTALLPNFPNPFNPETWIPYQLAEPSRVRIVIHDLSGRRVRTLDLGERPAGAYLSREKAAYWDGRNDQGEPVSSGIYFYTLETGDTRFTRRMSIVR